MLAACGLLESYMLAPIPEEFLQCDTLACFRGPTKKHVDARLRGGKGYDGDTSGALRLGIT